MMARSAAPRSIVLAMVLALVAITASGCWNSDEERPPRKVGDTVSGSTLEIGETATLPLSDGEGTVRVKVTELVKGDPADLARYRQRYAKPGDEPIVGDPYYVRYELTSSSAAARVINSTRLITVHAGGEMVTHLTLAYPFAPCQQELWPFAEAGVGPTVTGCSIWLRKPGDPELDTVVANGQDDDHFQVQWNQ